jgi:hypothetical protein
MDWGLAKRLGADDGGGEGEGDAPSPSPWPEALTATGAVLGRGARTDAASAAALTRLCLDLRHGVRRVRWAQSGESAA